MIELTIKNISKIKGMYSKKALEKILSTIEQGEKLTDAKYQVSLVFCNDEFIKGLNKNYRGKNKPTDVLSFPVPESFPQYGDVKLLGEIYISLETILNRNENDLSKAKSEVKLLFCHGILHLLGYSHDTPEEREEMTRKQSKYLGIHISDAWIKPAKKRNSSD